MIEEKLTKELNREIAHLSCNKEFGFEGKGTYPQCGDCIVCKCRKETGWDEDLHRFEK